jgi:hypothetical protein
VEVEEGFAVGTDNGEWGGGLYWFGHDGLEKQMLDQNTNDLAFDGERLVAGTGLDHLGLRAGGLTIYSYAGARETSPSTSPFTISFREWQGIPLGSAVRLVDVTAGDVLAVRTGGISILTIEGLLISQWEPSVPSFQRPNSTALLADGTVLVGGTNGLAVWKNFPADPNPVLYIPDDCVPTTDDLRGR